MGNDRVHVRIDQGGAGVRHPLAQTSGSAVNGFDPAK